MEEEYITLGIFFSILSLLYLICICCGFKQLKAAINVIDASADFLRDTKKIIVVNIIYFLMSLITLFICLGGFVGILSMGEIKPNTRVVPQGKEIIIPEEDKGKVYWMSAYMLFGTLWLQAFISAKLSFIVMVSASSYYFDSSSDKEGKANIKMGFKFTYFYHLGSLALGSFLISLVQFIRIVFVTVAEQAQKAGDENPTTQCIFACASCLLKCCEKITDYINQQAYAYMAVSGDSFCSSAWNGFLLNLKYCLKFAWSNFLASMFIFLGKMTVVIINTACVYFFMKYVSRDIDDVSMMVGPLFMVAIVTYLISNLFLGIFDEVVLSLMTCLAIDSDLHDGVPVYGPPTFHDSFGEKVSLVH